MLIHKNIHLIERNVRGAWVIYGAIGVRQYYGYSKSEAARRYEEEAKKTILENKKTKGGSKNDGQRIQNGISNNG